MHHLVPTRNPHVGKAPRNKGQSGAVLSLHHRCWWAVRTQGGCRGSQGSPDKESPPRPGLAQTHWASSALLPSNCTDIPQLLRQTACNGNNKPRAQRQRATKEYFPQTWEVSLPLTGLPFSPFPLLTGAPVKTWAERRSSSGPFSGKVAGKISAVLTFTAGRKQRLYTVRTDCFEALLYNNHVPNMLCYRTAEPITHLYFSDPRPVIAHFYFISFGSISVFQTWAN